MARERTWNVAIVCDGCRRTRAGDADATTQADAEDGLRARLVEEQGWRCDTSGDWCLSCRAPAPRPVDTTWDEVETVTRLHELDDALARPRGHDTVLAEALDELHPGADPPARPASNPDLWR